MDCSTCIAYYFDKLVVVEFDRESHATYVFEKDKFEGLREKTRWELRDKKPEGFLGRVIHVKNDEEKWKQKIDNLLTS